MTLRQNSLRLRQNEYFILQNMKLLRTTKFRIYRLFKGSVLSEITLLFTLIKPIGTISK